MKKNLDRVDNIMENLGFNPAGSDSTKAAFIKNLIKQAYGVDVPVPSRYKTERTVTFEEFTIAAIHKNLLPTEKPDLEKEGQLQFDFETAQKPKVG